LGRKLREEAGTSGEMAIPGKRKLALPGRCSCGAEGGWQERGSLRSRREPLPEPSAARFPCRDCRELFPNQTKCVYTCT